MRRRNNAIRFLGLLLGAAVWLGGTLSGCDPQPWRFTDAAVPPDAAPDAGPPLRRLERRGLLGAAPLKNRVFDPEWKVVDGLIWNPQNPLNGELAVFTRLHQRTPLGQVALRVQPPPGESSTQLVGLVKGAAGPVVVSVWMGRLEGSNPAGMTATLYGLFDHLGNAVELEADPTQTPVVLDGVTWLRFSAYLEDGPIATAHLRLVNQATEPAFFSAPVLERAPWQARWLPGARRPGRRRALEPIERAFIREFLRRTGERFGGPRRALRP